MILIAQKYYCVNKNHVYKENVEWESLGTKLGMCYQELIIICPVQFTV